jgi:PAS domain S-box-containing protein
VNTTLEKPQEWGLQGRTILIVDDEPANLGVVSNYLESAGFGVLIARDGISGLEKAQYAPPDLILLDVLMPEIDGFETCRQLKADEALRDIPVIFMTALAETEQKIKGFEVGAVDYITKPFRHEELLARVTTHLRLRDLTERLEVKVQERTEELLLANQQLRRYTERLEGLQQVGLELAAQLDLDALLHSIVSRAVELGGGNAGGLYLHRPEREVLELVVAVGAGQTFVGSTLQPGEGLSGEVWETDEPLAVTDYHSWSGRSPLYDELELKAVLAVPIRWGQQRLGVLFVWTGMPHVFSPSDTQLLSILATQAAVAIENARLFQAERGQCQLADTLREVAGALNTSLDLEQVLDLILEQVAHVVEYDNASVMLLADGSLEIAAQQGFLPGDQELGPFQVADFAHLADVLQERRPGIIPDTTTDPRWQYRRASQNIHSWLGVPLAVQDRAIGLLNLGKEEVNFYTQRDAEVLTAFANQAAIAIENAHLYDRTRRRSRELALLNRVIAASAASREIEPILETACRELALIFDVPRAAAALFGEDKAEALVVAEYPPAGLWRAPWPGQDGQSSRPGQRLVPGQLPSQGEAIPTEDLASLQYILKHKEPFVVENAQAGPSLLVLPLIVEGEVAGTLEVTAIDPRRFAADEVALAQGVAEQVAGALARARLEETQQRLNTAVEQAAEAIVITDLHGIILYVNPAFESITGCNRAQTLGLGPATATTRGPDVSFYDQMWHSMATTQVEQGRFTGRKPDGTSYTVDAIVTPVRNQAGRLVNYVAAWRDVTREVQLEKQFQQAQKMEALGRLAGGVAHDFNNLLTVIHLNSQIMKRKLRIEDPLWEHVQEIEETSQRAADLIKQLFSFSRREIVEPQVLSLNNIVGDLIPMLQRLIGADIVLEPMLATDLWPVKADHSQMEQVIVNLVVNARDAMPEGGTLIVETNNVVLDETYTALHMEAQPGEHVLLAISDTGTGMSDEVQARIFEPFFTTKEKGRGTGFGLATVFGIIKQHGGHIQVCSEVGRGTTFKIHLPRAGEAGTVGQVPAHVDSMPDARTELSRTTESKSLLSLREGMAGGTETALIVEDDPNVRGWLERVLKLCGYQTLIAQDGKEAVEISQQHEGSIHLLLTDVVMPQMGGPQLAEQIRLQRPGMRVLYTSGYTDSAIVLNGALIQGAAFISKPFTLDSLTQKARALLDDKP